MTSIAMHQERGLPAGALVSAKPDPGATVGTVVSFEQKVRTMVRPSEPAMILHVRSYGADGSPLAPLKVELRGEEIDGEIAIGDWVQMPASWSPGTTLARVTNLTTGQIVELHRNSVLPALGALTTLLFAATMVGWIAIRTIG